MKSLPDIVYDGDAHLSLDLYLPDSLQAEACVIYAHGGGFRKGGRDHVEALHFARHFTQAGFALASVSYRLDTPARAFSASDQASIERCMARSRKVGLTLSPRLYGPAFMAAVEDLSKAVSFLWREGHSLGIKAPKVGILGVSSGGVAALALAYPPVQWHHRVSRPGAVVAISSAFVQPWRLNEEGPPCLMINGVRDRIIHLQNARIGALRADQVGAPVTLHNTRVPGHLAQVDLVLDGMTRHGERYMQLMLDEFARLHRV